MASPCLVVDFSDPCRSLWGSLGERHCFASVALEQPVSGVSVGCALLAGQPSPQVEKPLLGCMAAAAASDFPWSINGVFALLVMGQILSLLVMLRQGL